MASAGSNTPKTGLNSVANGQDPLSLFASQKEITPNSENSSDTEEPFRDSIVSKGSLKDFDIEEHIKERGSSSGTSSKNNSSSPLLNHKYLTNQNINVSVKSSRSSPEVGRIADEIKEKEKESSGDIPLLLGEQKLLFLKDAALLHPMGEYLTGNIAMTSYRLVFLPLNDCIRTFDDSYAKILDSWLEIPLGCIDKVEREKCRKSTDIRNHSLVLNISCKDTRFYKLSFQYKPSTVISSPNDPLHHTESDIDRAVNLIFAYAFPNQSIHLFAFSYGLSANKLFPKLDPYDPVVELSRMGIIDSADSPWRISVVNSNYTVCDSYPKLLVVPKRFKDEELQVVAHFRSAGRLPVLCWGNKNFSATIWRSSQPKAGVSGSCSLDEKYLDIIAKSSKYHEVPPSYFEQFSPKSKESQPNPTPQTPTSGIQSFFSSGSSKHSSINFDKLASGFGIPNDMHKGSSDDDNILMIVDCRPKANALVNRAAGAGYEASSNYKNSRLDFYNIGNIHVMRDSFRALQAALSPNSGINADLNYTKTVEDSQWLSHLRLVLKASWDTANFVTKGYPVLIHCSHGWDRTPQITAIGQLFLDPFYRTLDGFRVLVEKEWLSYGHQFSLRCAHGKDKAQRQDDQISPIFLQFLDCVWQIYNQNITYFEFNSRFIILLADQIYSCRFGTFIADTERERGKLNIDSKCVSCWPYIFHNRTHLLNPLYDPSLGVLLPPISRLLRGVTLWSDYFCRWNEALSPKITPILSFQEDSTLTRSISSSSSLSEQDALDLSIDSSIATQEIYQLAYFSERNRREKYEKMLAEVSVVASESEIPDIKSLSINENEKNLNDSDAKE